MSGRKDSLAQQGFPTIGFHLDLGIGGDSSRSLERSDEFARERGLELHVHSLSDDDPAAL